MSEEKLILYQKRQGVRKIVFIVILFLLIILFTGCAKTTITKTQYQEVMVPVKCEAKLPQKPIFDTNDLNTAKELMQYFETCEKILLECVKYE
ncbi:hypothetical protein [Campylobacter suis]|uniref:Lipoprotein n=1 Tax=Campylobacter suis TaxID=2790657 RepID=A0ABN7K6U3_9BACT|nr:hypothetical protein [Campylobacter suis]CAD7288197.1 hypothetical protein LMG8286_01186 [Campylobacter suis]